MAIMWRFKKKEKPTVEIYNNLVVFEPNDVRVVDFRDSAFGGNPEDYAFKRSTIGEAFAPKPDTIESLINRLIELGEPKPEVVITGKTMAGGESYWTVDIDGEKQGRCVSWVGGKLNWFDTLDKAEQAVKDELKSKLSRVVTKTTTITY